MGQLRMTNVLCISWSLLHIWTKNFKDVISDAFLNLNSITKKEKKELHSVKVRISGHVKFERGEDDCKSLNQNLIRSFHVEARQLSVI